MTRKPDVFLILAALSLMAGTITALFLWDWRYLTSGVVGAVGCAIIDAAFRGREGR